MHSKSSPLISLLPLGEIPQELTALHCFPLSIDMILKLHHSLFNSFTVNKDFFKVILGLGENMRIY